MSRRGWVLFLAMSVIWGIPYLLIKVAVDETSPVVVVFARCVVGAAILLPWTIAKGQLRPALRHWRALLLFTLLEMAAPWLLLSYAETRLSSSLTGRLVATVPFVAALGRQLDLSLHADPSAWGSMITSDAPWPFVSGYQAGL